MTGQTSSASVISSLAAMLRSPSAVPPDSPGLATGVNTAIVDGQEDAETGSRAGQPTRPSLSSLRRSSTGTVPRAGELFIRDSPPLRRSGLLQPRSYNPPNNFGRYDISTHTPISSQPPTTLRVPHSQDIIRMNTVELSAMSFPPGLQQAVVSSNDAVPHSHDASLSSSSYYESTIDTNESLAYARPGPVVHGNDLASSKPSASKSTSPSVSLELNYDHITPRMPSQPSGLSLLRQEYEHPERIIDYNTEDDGSRTPTPIVTTINSPLRSADTSSGPRVRWTESPSTPLKPRSILNTTMRSATPTTLAMPPSASITTTSETTPLLLRQPLPLPSTQHPPPPSSSSTTTTTTTTPDHITKPFWITSRLGIAMSKAMQAAPRVPAMVFRSIPAVLLGCLLNVLDGVSYGMIIFPSTGIFSNLGPTGVSLFFLSTMLSQLVYTLGGSGFAGGNGSMMIEVVPFFHIIANDIASQIGEDSPDAVIATTLAAFALSSILTGLSFFLLGALKLGVLIGFFPRHILVGCIGGVGAFLIITGFTVSMRIDEDALGANWATIETMFFNTHHLILWVIPLALAVLLRVITSKFHHQLILPMYFLLIIVVFYIVIAAARLDLAHLRQAGWIFDLGLHSSGGPWYQIYSLLDLGIVRYSALWATLPTQLALLFFNILHPPLNVPALSVSLNEDVNTDKELVAHGYSNLLAGLFGTVPNYLVYVNTLLFYRVGGHTRIAGFLLATMTGVLLVIGTAPIGYIPVSVVGALIFVLGIDLVKEALWDTRHRASRTEYITIVSIIVFMTVWDFVVGVIFGIVASCFFFVVENSQRKSIRSLQSGETAMSTVRRPSLQRAYLREVSKQTTVLTLQGFLFFGTINHVEDTIRGIIEGPAWQNNPIRFLVLDLTLVAGVDMSSAEAFVRIHRFLSAKLVTMVFCGFPEDSAVAKSLQSAQVLGSDDVEMFSTFNDAMEWTENVYLRSWYMAQKYESPSRAVALPGRRRQDFDPDQHPLDSLVSSPRRSHLRDVGNRTIAHEPNAFDDVDSPSELSYTLLKAFSTLTELEPNFFRSIEKYLERMSFPEGHVLWEQGDPPDGLYIVESGVLRASYCFANDLQHVEESMVPGTLAGELSALSSLPRNATVVVEHAATLWKLSDENLNRLEREEPGLGRCFLGLVLKAAKIDHDILLSALASRR